ncbi:MAG: vWA domain-containing protein [Promethearchaeota archaeon]
MKYEIIRKKSTPKRYKDLARNLNFNDTKGLTGLSVKEDNINSLMSLAQSNIYAVTAELQKPEYTQFFSKKHKQQQDGFIPQLYFMVRSHAPPQFKILLQRLTRSIILRTSLNISGRGSKGKARHRIRYYPGLPEFDLEQTLFNYIQKGCKNLSMEDIVGYERRQRKRSVVLMLDTSGSMFGKLLLNAALTTSVLSYAMNKDFTSIILFNSEAYIMKPIKIQRQISMLIDEILESEAMGFTNISKALRKGIRQLKKTPSNHRKIGILITDGDYNRGGAPERLAREFPKLHVINIPPEKSKEIQTRGQNVCKRIASAGRGFYIPVNEITEIPRALMNLLSKI